MCNPFGSFIDTEKLYHDLKRDLPPFVNVMQVKKSPGVMPRSKDQRREMRDFQIRQYFEGKFIMNCRNWTHGTRVSIFSKVQGHFKSSTWPYLRLPSCRATRTASDSKKSMQKRHF